MKISCIFILVIFLLLEHVHSNPTDTVAQQPQSVLPDAQRGLTVNSPARERTISGDNTWTGNTEPILAGTNKITLDNVKPINNNLKKTADHDIVTLNDSSGEETTLLPAARSDNDEVVASTMETESSEESVGDDENKEHFSEKKAVEELPTANLRTTEATEVSDENLRQNVDLIKYTFNSKDRIKYKEMVSAERAVQSLMHDKEEQKQQLLVQQPKLKNNHAGMSGEQHPEQMSNLQMKPNMQPPKLDASPELKPNYQHPKLVDSSLVKSNAQNPKQIKSHELESDMQPAKQIESPVVVPDVQPTEQIKRHELQRDVLHPKQIKSSVVVPNAQSSKLIKKSVVVPDLQHPKQIKNPEVVSNVQHPKLIKTPELVPKVQHAQQIENLKVAPEVRHPKLIKTPEVVPEVQPQKQVKTPEVVPDVQHPKLVKIPEVVPDVQPQKQMKTPEVVPEVQPQEQVKTIEVVPDVQPQEQIKTPEVVPDVQHPKLIKTPEVIPDVQHPKLSKTPEVVPGVQHPKLVKTPEVVPDVQHPKLIKTPEVVPEVQPQEQIKNPEVVPDVQHPKLIKTPEVVPEVQPQEQIKTLEVVPEVQHPKLIKTPEVVPEVQPQEQIKTLEVVSNAHPPKEKYNTEINSTILHSQKLLKKPNDNNKSNERKSESSTETVDATKVFHPDIASGNNIVIYKDNPKHITVKTEVPAGSVFIRKIPENIQETKDAVPKVAGSGKKQSAMGSSQDSVKRTDPKSSKESVPVTNMDTPPLAQHPKYSEIKQKNLAANLNKAKSDVNHSVTGTSPSNDKVDENEIAGQNNDSEKEIMMTDDLDQQSKGTGETVNLNQAVNDDVEADDNVDDDDTDPNKPLTLASSPKQKSTDFLIYGSMAFIAFVVLLTVLGVYFKKISFSRRYGAHMPLSTLEDDIHLFNRPADEHDTADYESWREYSSTNR